MISSFRGNYAFLSNFYPASVFYDGRWYKCNEAAFQAQKCPERAGEFIMLDGAAAKKLGRSVPLRKDWNAVKDEIMLGICISKFSNHPELLTALRGTGDDELVEGNTWHDTYWGVCNGVGENHLGKILMKVREMYAV